MADLLRGKWSITALASHCTDMPTSLILSEAESQCNIWVSQTQVHTYTHRHTHFKVWRLRCLSLSVSLLIHAYSIQSVLKMRSFPAGSQQEESRPWQRSWGHFPKPSYFLSIWIGWDISFAIYIYMCVSVCVYIYIYTYILYQIIFHYRSL